MKIAVLGAGSLGMIAGAMMTKGGHDCTLIDTNEEHISALNSGGAKIIGKYTETIPVKAALPGGLTEIFDIVMLQTKQMHMLEALKGIEKNTRENTQPGDSITRRWQFMCPKPLWL